MRRILGVLSIVVLSLGLGACGATDYTGWPGHSTQAEAKLLNEEYAFSGFGAALDGTYAYTVKYDNRNGYGDVTVTTYRNPVPGAFSADGIVDVDGDDIQGSAGSLTTAPFTPAGKFLPYWVYQDSDQSSCGFSANKMKLDKSNGAGPVILVCYYPAEEVDKNLDLQANFSSLDELLGMMWSGMLEQDFSLELSQLVIDGAYVPIENMPIDLSHNGRRTTGLTINNGPGAQSAIQALLANTEDLVPVRVGLIFEGGLALDVPSNMNIAFNHTALQELVQ